MKMSLGKVCYGLLLAVVLYGMTAEVVFMWRNPTCNEMGLIRHIGSVLTFEKLPEYQINTQEKEDGTKETVD
jgi:hypothetical protein